MEGLEEVEQAWIVLWAAAIAAVKNQCVKIIYGWLEVINDECYEKMQLHREYTPTHLHTTEGAGLITHEKKSDNHHQTGKQQLNIFCVFS